MAGWRYKTDSAAYYRHDKTTPVTPAQLRAVRNQLADGLMDVLDSLANRYAAGDLTLSAWAQEFGAAIRQGTTAGYLLGSGGTNAVTPDALNRIDALIAKQTPFAEQFIRDLGQAQLSPEQTRARAQLYAGTAVSSYESAMAYSNGIDLPTYPGMGDTECLGRCRCSWTIETTDTEVMAWWDTAGDANVCNSCLSLSQKYNPLRVPR
jgi:hypothetical protein